MKTTKGIYPKYKLQRTDGRKIDPDNEYFVLKVKGSGDKNHIEACRKAVLTYADEIRGFLPELSEDIIDKYGKINT